MTRDDFYDILLKNHHHMIKYTILIHSQHTAIKLFKPLIGLLMM